MTGKFHDVVRKIDSHLCERFFRECVRAIIIPQRRMWIGEQEDADCIPSVVHCDGLRHKLIANVRRRDDAAGAVAIDGVFVGSTCVVV